MGTIISSLVNSVKEYSEIIWDKSIYSLLNYYMKFRCMKCNKEKHYHFLKKNIFTENNNLKICRSCYSKQQNENDFMNYMLWYIGDTIGYSIIIIRYLPQFIFSTWKVDYQEYQINNYTKVKHVVPKEYLCNECGITSTFNNDMCHICHLKDIAPLPKKIYTPSSYKHNINNERICNRYGCKNYATQEIRVSGYQGNQYWMRSGYSCKKCKNSVRANLSIP